MKPTKILVLAMLFMLITAAAFAADPPKPVPDTGQTKCYNTDGNVIDCANTGQDGEIDTNPMSFTPHRYNNGER